VSCPAWEPLVTARENDPAVDPAGWGDALEHADGCPDCRRRALELDPTLIFRRLPSVPASEVDVDEMQAAVAALVRARRIEGERPEPRRAGWRRAGIAAAALVALVLEAGPRREAPAEGGESLAASQALVAAPVYEPIGESGARIYELPTEGYSVVMIVDSSFDV